VHKGLQEEQLQGVRAALRQLRKRELRQLSEEAQLQGVQDLLGQQRQVVHRHLGRARGEPGTIFLAKIGKKTK
jgi:hypothetical protein